MKRIAAAMALLLCGPLFAAPPTKSHQPAAKPQSEKISYLGGNDDGDYFLVDRTLHKFGDNGRSVYVLTNFKTAQTTERGKAYLSEVIQWYLKCDSRKVAFGQVVDFAGAMGNGDTVDEIAADVAPGDDQFHVVTPASIEEALLNAACKITPAS